MHIFTTKEHAKPRRDSRRVLNLAAVKLTTFK